MALQKILQTGVRKVRGNMAFLCDLASSFTTNVKQDKMFILTLIRKVRGNMAFLCDLAYSFTTNVKQDKMFILTLCTSKSYKIQVAKLATIQKF